MMDFRKKLSGYKKEMLRKLHLSKEQRNELVERLKMLKRKTIDKVLPTGDSIEETNVWSKIADKLFQGDIVLTKSVYLISPYEQWKICVILRKQQKQVIADILGIRSKRQTMYDGEYPGMRWTKGVRYFFDESASEQVQSVFKKAAHQWMSDTCINFIPTKFAEDSIRVFADNGCWSYVGRIGGVQNLSLGEGCEKVRFGKDFL
ncbi:astacin [Ostertagia ostertagi]